MRQLKTVDHVLYFIFSDWTGKPKRSVSLPTEKVDGSGQSFCGDDEDLYGSTGMLTYYALQRMLETHFCLAEQATLAVFYMRKMQRDGGQLSYCTEWVRALKILSIHVKKELALNAPLLFVKDLVLLAMGERVRLRVAIQRHGLTKSTAYRYADKTRAYLYQHLLKRAYAKAHDIYTPFLSHPQAVQS